MRAALRIKELHRNLRLLQLDGAAFALMVGVTEAYFVAFALAAGLSQVDAALVGTVPVLFGALLHGATPWGVRWLGSLRAWVTLNAGIQAISLGVLTACAWSGSIHPAVLYGLVTLYWGAGFATAPPWQAWVPTLVPRMISTHFFTSRNRTVQVFLGIGLCGGLILQWG